MFGDKPETDGVEEMRRAYEAWLPHAVGLRVEAAPRAL